MYAVGYPAKTAVPLNLMVSWVGEPQGSKSSWDVRFCAGFRTPATTI
jgi:hypothetical protein